MNKVRNAVIIIILCIIGAGVVKQQKEISLSESSIEDIKDVVFGRRAAQQELGIPVGAIPYTGSADRPITIHPKGNTLGDLVMAPRGSGSGGFEPLPNNPTPPQLSPSGPTE